MRPGEQVELFPNSKVFIPVCLCDSIYDSKYLDDFSLTIPVPSNKKTF